MTTAVQPLGPRWSDAIAPGTRLLLGVVKIERPAVEREDLSRPDVMALRTRYVQGVEAIARGFGALGPLVWQGDSIVLLFPGQRAPAGALAWHAARALWERTRVELNIPARIAAHVAEVAWTGEVEQIAGSDIDVGSRVAQIAPDAAVVVTEDVYLSLPSQEREMFALAGTFAQGAGPVYVFPSAEVARIDRERIFPAEDMRLWSQLRAYALGPEIARLRYVGFRLRKNEPPALDLLTVFQPLDVQRSICGDSSLDEAARDIAETQPEGEMFAPSLDARLSSLQRHAPSFPQGPTPFREAFEESRSLVVLGDPGAGKTTLLKWLAVVSAGGRLSLREALGVSERLLPLPISVGRFADVCRQSSDSVSVIEPLLCYFADRHACPEADLRSFLPAALEAGDCLVLLDGLDEVRTEERIDVHSRLERLAAAFPKNRYIASSRRAGYSDLSLPGGITWLVLPFTDMQVEHYLRSFQRAYVAWELGHADDRRADEESAKLVSAIRDHGRLAALARNPFLLSGLALVHRAEGALPRHRVLLYELFARTLCETWGQARRLVAGGSEAPHLAYEEEGVPILGNLALAMHEHHPAGVAPEPFVIESLEKTMISQGRAGGEDEARRAAEVFLRKAGADVQILLERGAGSWGFLHLTFQEFFVAAGLHAEERFEQVAFERLFAPRWLEVIRLGVGYMALVQKRPVQVQRFIERVLDYKIAGDDAYITSILEKQVPLAILLMTEAGDAISHAKQDAILDRFVLWVLRQPLHNASDVLMELRLTEAMPALGRKVMALLSEKSIATKAVRVLGKLGFPDACKTLVKALDSPNLEFAEAAAAALGELGRNEDVQKFAAAELIRHGSDEGVLWIENAARTGSIEATTFKSQGQLFEALEHSPHPRAEEVLRLLAQDHQYGIRPCLSLAKRGVRDAIVPLTQALDEQLDPETRNSILFALWILAEKSPPVARPVIPTPPDK